MTQLSFTGARWRLLPAPTDRVRELVRGGLREAVARCLTIRGLADPQDLEPNPSHLHDPFAMFHMDLAVERLERAARDGHRIRILTDYDVDGTTSSLILQAALRMITPDLHLDYHIPDRFTEGYGFSEAAAAKAGADGIDLLVTADIGVRDHAAVARARNAGVDVLICDHHLPTGATVPEGAIVLCPPQAACSYPNQALAACGVSTKLVQALLRDHPRRDRIVRSMLKLAAIGTVADLVSLATPENRAIVGLGLAELNRGPHAPGLTALLRIADLRPGEITASDLAFRVAPRINAAGRISTATHVVDLLNTTDANRARALAAELETLNETRRTVQQHLVDRALHAASAMGDAFIVVAGPEEDGWHRGVIGIVAARLKDELHRPVAVISIQGDLGVGSIRSVPSVHAVQALETAADLLHRFGGHPAAAGFSLPAERIDELRERFAAFMSHADRSGTVALEREVDALIRPDELDDILHEQLQRLGPFGAGNPEPRLVVRAPRPNGLRRIGRDGRHLKWNLPRRHGDPIEAIWWGGADAADRLLSGPTELLGNLTESRHQGRRVLQFVVTDVRSTVEWP